MKNSKTYKIYGPKSQKRPDIRVYTIKKKNPFFFNSIIEASFLIFFPQNTFIIWECYAIKTPSPPPTHSFSVEYFIFVNICKILIKFQRTFERISYIVRDFPITKSINRYADANAHAEQKSNCNNDYFYSCFFPYSKSGFPIFSRS